MTKFPEMKYKLFLLFFFICFLIAFLGCESGKQSSTDPEMIEKNLLIEENITKKFVVYQLFVRLFGNKNTTNRIYGTLEENGSGKFNDINDTALTGTEKIRDHPCLVYRSSGTRSNE